MKWSYIVWGCWAIAFLVLEFLGVFRIVPWKTLSETAWSLENISVVLRVGLLIGLSVLLTHIVGRWP